MDRGEPGTRLVAPDVDGVDAEDNGEDAGDAEWRNAFAKDADSENQDQGGAEAAGDGVGDREVGAAVGGGEGAEVEGVEEAGEGDPDPAVGGMGCWESRTRNGARKMTTEATRACQKKTALPRLCLASRFQLACRTDETRMRARAVTGTDGSDGIGRRRAASGSPDYPSQGLPRASSGRARRRPSRWLRCGPMIMSTTTAASWIPLA